MAEFQFGFKAYADNHPEVGNPLVDEHALGPNFNAQETSNGVLLYRKIANDVIYIPNQTTPKTSEVAGQAAQGPNVKWLGSPNFWAGRAGKPRAIVIHTMSGTLAGTDGWFANPASQVSAHYGVGLDGTVHQYVRLQDTAWANGILEAGNQWQALNLGDGNPNHLTVSIETEDKANPGQEVTDLQFTAVLEIAKAAVQQCPSISHLVGHNVISPQSRVNCPGPRWVASGRFAALAKALNLTPVP